MFSIIFKVKAMTLLNMILLMYLEQGYNLLYVDSKHENEIISGTL